MSRFKQVQEARQVRRDLIRKYRDEGMSFFEAQDRVDKERGVKVYQRKEKQAEK